MKACRCKNEREGWSGKGKRVVGKWRKKTLAFEIICECNDFMPIYLFYINSHVLSNIQFFCIWIKQQIFSPYISLFKWNSITYPMILKSENNCFNSIWKYFIIPSLHKAFTLICWFPFFQHQHLSVLIIWIINIPSWVNLCNFFGRGPLLRLSWVLTHWPFLRLQKPRLIPTLP